MPSFTGAVLSRQIPLGKDYSVAVILGGFKEMSSFLQSLFFFPCRDGAAYMLSSLSLLKKWSKLNLNSLKLIMENCNILEFADQY